MKLYAYREFDLCGDEYLNEEQDCLIGLHRDASDTIHLTYHPGEVDEADLGIPKVEGSRDHEKVFLTVERGWNKECYHITYLEMMNFVMGVGR